MKIAREYVTFRKLVESNDPGGKFFMECLHESYPENLWNEAYNMLADLCLYQREMEWGFHGIGRLINGFKKIDKESPYDNGYSSEHIWNAEVLDNDGKTLTLLLTTHPSIGKEIIAVKKVKF